MLLIEKIARRQPKINLWVPLFAYAKTIQQKYPSWAYHEWLVQLQIAPNVGLEPTTTRLRVLRSADWANRARRTCVVQTNSQINIHSLFPDLYHLPKQSPSALLVAAESHRGCNKIWTKRAERSRAHTLYRERHARLSKYNGRDIYIIIIQFI